MSTLELLQLRPIAETDQAFLRALYATTRDHEVAPLDGSPAAIDTFLSWPFDTQLRYYQANLPDAAFCVIDVDGRAIGGVSTGAEVKVYGAGSGTTTLAPFNASVSGSTNVVGSNVPFDIHSPYLGVNFIIALEGVFPSRN